MLEALDFGGFVVRRQSTSVSAITLLIVAIVTTAMLFSQWYLNRNPDYSCLQTSPPGKVDNFLVEATTGSWSWWPTGLICHYPTAAGGMVSIGPGFALSVDLAVSIAAAGTAVALFVRRALLRRRTALQK